MIPALKFLKYFLESFLIKRFCDNNSAAFTAISELKNTIGLLFWANKLRYEIYLIDLWYTKALQAKAMKRSRLSK